MGLPAASHALKKAKPYSPIGIPAETPVTGGPQPPVEPPPTGGLPLVQPVSSQFVQEHFGVCVHPTFNTSVYRAANQDAWFGYLTDMNVRYMRGSFSTNNPGAAAAAIKCRETGIKWIMTVVPEGGTTPTDQSVAETRAKVREIGDNFSDICEAIEGINEPNHNRAGADGTSVPIPADWATTTAAHQKAIWEEVQLHPNLKDKIQVLGPSLHDTAAYRSYTQATYEGGLKHWHQLVAAGIKPHQQWVTVHKYSGGFPPGEGLDSRLGHIYNAYGAAAKVWISETGFHNAINAPPPVHRPITEEGSGTYGPRAIMDLVARRKIAITRYELLDDIDAGRDSHESNFGMVAVGAFGAAGTLDPATWRAKPEVAKTKALLGMLYDPGAQYTPRQIGLKVETSSPDIQWVVTARRDGTALWWGWRSAPIWDPNNEVRLASGYTEFTSVITDRLGSREIKVGAEVVSLALR